MAFTEVSILPFMESGSAQVESMYYRCGLRVPGYVLRIFLRLAWWQVGKHAS